MGRENKKEAVAALHREQIMRAAEKLFLENGYTQTTIEDISKASEYSRRTIYAYYESKEDILHHIVEKGLIELKQDIENAISHSGDFITTYKEICMSIYKYQRECPNVIENVNGANAADFERDNLSDTVKNILRLGTEINTILAAFIEKGKKNGIVRQDTIPILTVFVLWSSLTSLFTLVRTKGQFISKQFAVSENEFLDYGFKQLINAILEIRI